MTPVIEICVDNMASVDACQETGIPRIELCAGLVEGGTTPSRGFLRQARASYSGRMMVMIRPRAGDFIVSASERRVMLDDIQAARDEGADGVVFGCLRPDGSIDLATAEIFVDAARGLDTTFHRAFDVSLDLVRSLDDLIALGISRVLTSGGQASVNAGLNTLIALQRQSAGRIIVLAGGGLKHDDITRLRPHGICEFHLSARTSAASPMVHRRPDIPMGATEVPGEYVRRQADPSALRALMNLLERPVA